MNTIVKTFALALAFTFSFTAFAGELADYPNVDNAVNNDTLTLYTYWACLDEGYELTETHVQPIYYQIPPQGEHLSHTVTITMTKTIGNPHNPREVKMVITEVQIFTKEDGNLTCRDMNISRQTVN